MGSVKTLAGEVTVEYDSTGSLNVAEQYAPVAEDNTNGVFAISVQPVASSKYAYTQYQNNSFATANAKPSGGNVFSFVVINTTASIRYFQLHNTATTPAGGATATQKFLVPANDSIVIGTDYFGPGGLNFATGIAVANSTTAATYTAGSAGDLLLDLNYK